MRWSGATGAIARCKRVSTGCGRKSRSVRVLRWICGVKLKPKAVNKPLPYFIVHELDKPGSSATVSHYGTNCSAQTLTRRYAYRPPTDLCQAASPASTGGRAWQRCRWNTEDITSTTPLAEEHHHTYGDVSGMSCPLQATLGTTSPGTWIEW